MANSVYRVVHFGNVMDYLIDSPDDCDAFISACQYAERYYIDDGAARIVQKQMNNREWENVRYIGLPST